jgi:hypothetical protein
VTGYDWAEDDALSVQELRARVAGLEPAEVVDTPPAYALVGNTVAAGTPGSGSSAYGVVVAGLKPLEVGGKFVPLIGRGTGPDRGPIRSADLVTNQGRA